MIFMAKLPRPHRLIPFATLLLAGCLFDTGGEKVAGGAEDFPNTVALGVALNDDIGGQADWDQFSNIPATLPSFQGADSLVLAPGAAVAKTGSEALAKSSASGQVALKPDTTWDLTDTATLGVARRYISQVLLTKFRWDSTTFLYDDKAKDTIVGNETVLEAKGLESAKSGVHLQAYHYFNRDSAGPLDSAAFYLRQRGLDGLYRNNWLTVTGGADGDIFTKADNVPTYYAFGKTDESGARTDTVEAFDISDADGDGLLWGANDSGLVDFRQKKTNPDGRPGVKTVVQKMRAILFKEEQKTYPVSFTEIRTDAGGKRVVFSVKGTRPDSAFGPGDTVFVNVKTVPADGDTRFQERNARFVILLSQTPKQFSENLFISFNLQTTWRPGAWKKGGIKTTTLRFKPDEPVASNHLALAGDLDVDVVFEDGSTGKVTGRRLVDKQLILELKETLPSGKTRRFELHFDLNGALLLRKVL
jgi:hypothetical protein